MPLVVRVRPNAAYLVALACALAVLVGGILAAGGAVGVAMIFAGGLVTVMFGYPVVTSTLVRVPAVVVGPDGLRLPLMGVRLDWREVADVRTGVRSQVPVLLVVPRDPAAVIARLRPWLRREARTELATLGAPVVIDPRSLDHDLDQIRAAIEASRPSQAPS